MLQLIRSDQTEKRYNSQKQVYNSTTAVDDIDRNEPTNTPSDNFAPHNCKVKGCKLSIQFGKSHKFLA